MKERNLIATLQKSYYGKAKVIEDENGESLKSYDTIVCAIHNGVFVRFWGGYSRTTMNHINDFRRSWGLPMLNKKAWEALPCDSKERYKVECSNGFVSWTTEAVFDSEEQAETFAEEIEARHGGRVYAFPVAI